MSNTVRGHVPDTLIYGPVMSRRFGRSLGLSLSLPERWTCSWRCPYCQIGKQPRDDVGKAPWPSLSRLKGEWEDHLSHHHHIDAVTLAGSGEPTLHPDFKDISPWICSESKKIGATSVLLTNGDGLLNEEHQVAALAFDKVYIKFDPGAPCGAWRRCTEDGRIRRLELLSEFNNLRLQSLIYRTATGEGNSGEEAMNIYFHMVFMLKPKEIHLTTVEREAPSPNIKPVDPSTLARWADRAGELGVPLAVF